MVAELINRDEARAFVIRALGLATSPEGIEQPEVIAALIRRTASVSCPCAPSLLKKKTMLGLRGLIEDEAALTDAVDAGIEGVAAYGDLVELPANFDDEAELVLYTTPPAFVQTSSGTAFVVGVADDGQDVLPTALARRLQVRGYARSLHAEPGEDLGSLLASLGLQEIPRALWFKRPRTEEASKVVQSANATLERSPASPVIEELEILDLAMNPLYYRGRWTKPGRRSGRFVARRAQRYGAPLWCYVELVDGTAKLLLDLRSAEWRGCDCAWRLQMAIDALAGNPQRYAAEFSEDGDVIVRFFSPVPAWAQKQWDLTFVRVERPRCLFAYQMTYDQFEAEIPRLSGELWLSELTKAL